MNYYTIFRRYHNRQSQPMMVAVLLAESIDKAFTTYSRMEQLSNTIIKLDRNNYVIGKVTLTIRMASNDEIQNFRAIRGPRTIENEKLMDHQLPVIFCGMPEQVSGWVKEKQLRWKQVSDMLYGGYYVDDVNGECYFPMSS